MRKVKLVDEQEYSLVKNHAEGLAQLLTISGMFIITITNIGPLSGFEGVMSTLIGLGLTLYGAAFLIRLNLIRRKRNKEVLEG